MSSRLEVEEALFEPPQDFKHTRLLSRVSEGVSYNGYYLEKHKNMFNIYFFYDATEGGDDYGFINEIHEGEDLVGSFTYEELLEHCRDPNDKNGHYRLPLYRRFCLDILYHTSALSKL